MSQQPKHQRKWSEAMRQLAGNNKQLQDNGRQLWSFAAMPKIWAEKIEVLEQK